MGKHRTEEIFDSSDDKLLREKQARLKVLEKKIWQSSAAKSSSKLQFDWKKASTVYEMWQAGEISNEEILTKENKLRKLKPVEIFEKILDDETIE